MAGTMDDSDNRWWSDKIQGTTHAIVGPTQQYNDGVLTTQNDDGMSTHDDNNMQKHGGGQHDNDTTYYIITSTLY